MILSYIIIAILILFDFLLKSFYSGMYALNQIEVIIPNVLTLGYIRNYGASFGMLQDQQMFFFIITLIALAIFGYLFSTSNIKTKKLYTISLIFLISGTIGNGIDRLLYGYVIDYIQVPILPFVGNTFFNLADALLNIGIALLFIEFIIEGIKDYNKKKREKDGTN
ncbi:Lipoprotein signal peptidase [Acholeplasma oculi]|uniref:Lipoprotein signal peptidase n=1 Tax=Acholeplasma oculi TaxID=35623 RepID=A0A061AJ26_9MOLU|nr:signal peptidase II [Acholeplasma oculi]CDR30997.1 Lipoprotein signal peptidase [Acholeplasma oculi]SKC36141.1 signal peptidase II [Acholeplasma oculi]SUT90417.1 Lipoprotein signal peptidase [Acholeplasma oculi]